jgi:hypothetical protein
MGRPARHGYGSLALAASPNVRKTTTITLSALCAAGQGQGQVRVPACFPQRTIHVFCFGLRVVFSLTSGGGSGVTLPCRPPAPDFPPPIRRDELFFLPLFPFAIT